MKECKNCSIRKAHQDSFYVSSKHHKIYYSSIYSKIHHFYAIRNGDKLTYLFHPDNFTPLRALQHAQIVQLNNPIHSKSCFLGRQGIEHCLLLNRALRVALSNGRYAWRLWHGEWGPSLNSKRIPRPSRSLFGEARLQETGAGCHYRPRASVRSCPTGKPFL